MTSAVKFVKCPHCSFENIHPEVIAHHIKYGHTTITKAENTSKSDETGTVSRSEMNQTDISGMENE